MGISDITFPNSSSVAWGLNLLALHRNEGMEKSMEIMKLLVITNCRFFRYPFPVLVEAVPEPFNP